MIEERKNLSGKKRLQGTGEERKRLPGSFFRLLLLGLLDVPYALFAEQSDLRVLERERIIHADFIAE